MVIFWATVKTGLKVIAIEMDKAKVRIIRLGIMVPHHQVIDGRVYLLAPSINSIATPRARGGFQNLPGKKAFTAYISYRGAS
jgi:hypothetical protein